MERSPVKDLISGLRGLIKDLLKKELNGQTAKVAAVQEGLTPGQKAGRTRKRRAAARKAATTKALRGST
jgi:hypothetical protein